MREEPKDFFVKDENGFYIYDVHHTGMNQRYEEYTAEDHQVWQILFDRQIAFLQGKVTEDYLKGIDIVKFSREKIPQFEQVNKLLQATTGWNVYIVPGLIPSLAFFELMERKNFCATTWLRKMEQLDYLEEPDMFHDVFGHVPLLTNQNLCDFLVNLSKIALKHIDNDHIISCIGRLYWFTIEFGLIQESKGLRIYGAGIVSSKGETEYSLYSDIPQRLPYNVAQILNTDYHKDRYQDVYFVIDSFEQLYNSIDEIDQEIDKIVEKTKAIA